MAGATSTIGAKKRRAKALPFFLVAARVLVLGLVEGLIPIGVERTTVSTDDDNTCRVPRLQHHRFLVMPWLSGAGTEHAYANERRRY
jgi:hypothetical protein